VLIPVPWRLLEIPSVAPSLAQPQPLLLAHDLRDPLPESVRAALAASLAPAEQQRWEALRLPEDRERFLRGRGALRRLLGAWRDEPPEAVPIGVGAHGKPCCLGGPEFNLSHSGNLILLAVHQQRPVGVDVEQLRPGLAWRPIAQRVLPPAEWQALEVLATALEQESAEQEAAEAERQAAEAFLAAWCRLEARLKAQGLGLAGLGQPVPVADEAEGLGVVTSDLELWDVAVPPGYRAALALASVP
jgi:4'-phosphopantetheinyl transferase